MTRPDRIAKGRKTGTREWSEHSVNCCLGCQHSCLYCYGRQAALRWGKIKRGEDWTTERVDADAASRTRKKYAGVVMFPTQHDLSDGNRRAYYDCLFALLVAGNNVLVVSKAGMELPALLARLLGDVAERGDDPLPAMRVEVRASITALDAVIARFWEPGAPAPGKRLQALANCASLGVRTSISIEPCLDVRAIPAIIAAARDAGVAGEIWIGAANHLRQRTAWCRGLERLEGEIYRVEEGQTPEAMRRIYESLKGNSQIRWKDSYQKALGIDAKGKPQT
jgi:DNA repair photolyase